MSQLYNKIKPAPARIADKNAEKAIDDVRKALDQIYKLLDVSSNDNALTIGGNIHCKSLYVDGDSIYIGGVKLKAPTSSEDTYYLRFSKANNRYDYVATASATTHASTHDQGGTDPIDPSFYIAMSVALGAP
jgi:hypothetical protein